MTLGVRGSCKLPDLVPHKLAGLHGSWHASGNSLAYNKATAKTDWPKVTLID